MRPGTYDTHILDHMGDVWCIAVGHWNGREWDQVDIYQPKGVIWSLDEMPTREDVMGRLNSYLEGAA